MPQSIKDPPEVRQYARRGDPPVDKWPGRLVTREDLMAAAGDPRDMFRYGHRLGAYQRAWRAFAISRKRRRKFHVGFDWNQILVLGDYGAGKTTAAIHLALHYFRLGHPVFSNASTLFGWRLRHDQVYTAMAFMPANSVLVIDESSAVLDSLLGHSVAVSSFSQMNLNTRKKNCKVIYMSAHDWEIAPSIRRNCKEVWMPVPRDSMKIEGDDIESVQRPADDPDNFRLAYHVWDDYPYRKANLIEGKEAQKTDGFGKPAYTFFDQGAMVRDAMALNDTFELAAAGAARVADRNAVKENLAAAILGVGPVDSANGTTTAHKDEESINRLLLYFQEKEADYPVYFTPGELANVADMDVGAAGRLVHKIVPGIKNVQRHGYPASEIYAAIDQLQEVAP